MASALFLFTISCETPTANSIVDFFICKTAEASSLYGLGPNNE